MSNEIKIGMEFGSYNAKINSLSQDSIVNCNDKSEKKGFESECIFRDAETKSIRGNAFKEKIPYNEYGQPEYCKAAMFLDEYEYGTVANSSEKLDKFDYINTENAYALDFNGNGKVDEGEVFNGKLDRTAYRQAKIDGDLSKYLQYKNKFIY